MSSFRASFPPFEKSSAAWCARRSMVCGGIWQIGIPSLIISVVNAGNSGSLYPIHLLLITDLLRYQLCKQPSKHIGSALCSRLGLSSIHVPVTVPPIADISDGGNHNEESCASYHDTSDLAFGVAVFLIGSSVLDRVRIGKGWHGARERGDCGRPTWNGEQRSIRTKFLVLSFSNFADEGGYERSRGRSHDDYW